MQDCELLGKCRFVLLHQEHRAALWRTLIQDYCRGPLHEQCVRKKYHKRTGECAPDNMVPTGMIPDVFENIK